MMRGISILALLAALAACENPGNTVDEGGQQTDANPSASATADASGAEASATAEAGGARNVEERNELIDFSYSYPEAAGRIAPLARQLETMLDEAHDSITADAEEGREAARDSGFPFNQFWFHQDWKVVTDLPGWLSLSAEISTYMGGAHGNQTFDSLVWNKADGERMDPAQLFTTPAALSAAIRDSFCEELDRQRARKRGSPVDRESDDMFAECIDPVEDGVLILGSSNGRTFNRIGVLVPPYAAGPYAEGSYEVTLPVTASVIEVVKPEFRASFSASRN